MRKGFTLIELLIAMGLVLVVTGMVLPSYLNTNKVQKVVAAEEKIKQAYIQARDNALSGKKDCSVCDGVDNDCGTADDLPLQGWVTKVVGPVSGIYSVQVWGDCNVGNFPGAYTQFFLTSVDFPKGISVNVSNASAQASGVLFRSGGQGIYPPLVTGNNITVTVSDGTNNRTFIINGYGGIQ